MSAHSFKILIPALAVLSLTACENMYKRPLAIPSGYTYHNDEYKSPPSPEPDYIGYHYTAEQNNMILESLRVKADELFAQIDSKNNLSGETLYVFNAHDANAQNTAFDTVLRDAIRKKGYTLGDKYSATMGLGYAFNEPDTLQADVNFGDFNQDHRILPIFKSYNDYERMILELALMKGPSVVDSVRGVYTVPMFGYQRDGGLPYFLQPIVGTPMQREGGAAYRPEMNKALDQQKMIEKKERGAVAAKDYDGNAPQALFNQ